LFGWLYSEDETQFILLQDTLKYFKNKKTPSKEIPLKALKIKPT
jgi:hypothetical protein